MTTCAYCILGPQCPAEFNQYGCTRAPDHPGEHVACGGDDHAMFRWGGDSA